MTEITPEAPAPVALPTPAESAAPVLPEVPVAPVDLAALEKVTSGALRRPATLADLRAKKRREADIVVSSVDADGGQVQLVLRFRALSAKAFDDLQAKYPPTTRQKQDGLPYNPDTFGPALVAAVCIEPVLTVEDVKALMEDESWSVGEIATLVNSAFMLCNQDAGIPFTVSG